MATIGSGARRKTKNYQRSRYACYLSIQNADPEKEIFTLGQTYFAVQTRRQEVAEAEALAGLNEDQRRLYLRGQLADHILNHMGATELAANLFRATQEEHQGA